MTPPSAPVGPSPTPYRMEFAGGFSHRNLGGDLPPFSGPHFQFKMGRNFPHRRRHQFSLNGVYRQSFLFNQQRDTQLGLKHFGLELGYEAWVKSGLLSLFLFGGLGADVYASEDVRGDEDQVPLPIKDRLALGLALGAGFGLGRGAFRLSGAYRPSLGLVGREEENDLAVALSPRGLTVGGSLDLTKFKTWDPAAFPEPDGRQFAEGIRMGLIVDGSYTYNFNRPSDGSNATRIFDRAHHRPMNNLNQFSLIRETDEDSFGGFGIVLDTGENPQVSAAEHSLSGNYWDLQQIWGEARLPTGAGLTLRGGKIPTIIGYEVIEPLNNQISRSWGFGLAVPFTHWGMTASYPVDDRANFTLGLIKGWDDWAGHESGAGGLLGIFHDPARWFHWSLSSALGGESGRVLSVVDGILTFTKARFSFSINGDWGHQGDAGENSPKANWYAASLMPRIDFHHLIGLSGRAELFADPQGVRSGVPQTLGHGALTLHWKPVPERHFEKFPLEIRTELRHDRSSARPFLKGSDFSGSQTTFAVSATLYYQNLLQFRRSSPSRGENSSL